MARSALGEGDAAVMIPPPAVRDKQLQQLQAVRDQMERYYAQQLKPVWQKVLQYWSERPGGTI